MGKAAFILGLFAAAAGAWMAGSFLFAEVGSGQAGALRPTDPGLLLFAVPIVATLGAFQLRRRPWLGIVLLALLGIGCVAMITLVGVGIFCLLAAALALADIRAARHEVGRPGPRPGEDPAVRESRLRRRLEAAWNVSAVVAAAGAIEGLATFSWLYADPMLFSFGMMVVTVLVPPMMVSFADGVAATVALVSRYATSGAASTAVIVAVFGLVLSILMVGLILAEGTAWFAVAVGLNTLLLASAIVGCRTVRALEAEAGRRGAAA